MMEDVPLIMEDIGPSLGTSHFVRCPSTSGEGVPPF
jgi:hypothetical protein